MNLQENIRRILREETKHLNMILRRIDIDELEKEFNESLKYISKLFVNNYKSSPSKLSKNEFTRMVLFDLIHGTRLRHYFPEDVEWYHDVIKSLQEHYEDRIEFRYKKLISKI